MKPSKVSRYLQQQKLFRSSKPFYSITEIVSIYNSRNYLGLPNYSSNFASLEIYNSRNYLGLPNSVKKDLQDFAIYNSRNYLGLPNRKLSLRVPQNLQQQKLFRSSKLLHPLQTFAKIYNSRNYLGLPNVFTCDFTNHLSTTVEIIQVFQTSNCRLV